jgi:hypothetical protein
MTRSPFVLVLGLTSLLLFCSCGASIKLSPGTTPRAAKAKDYQVKVYQKTDTVKVKHTTIGLISVEDSGLTVDCSHEVMFNKAVEKARAIGADAIQIIQVDTPGFFSSCYQIKVLAIAYE